MSRYEILLYDAMSSSLSRVGRQRKCRLYLSVSWTKEIIHGSVSASRCYIPENKPPICGAQQCLLYIAIFAVYGLCTHY
jgi:hypothetical protein